jgi:nitrite reductase/ring-hydroxylating ferredoxin subunit/uncharacterized membrane protein
MALLDAVVARLGQTTTFDKPAAWLSEALSHVTHRPPISTALGGTWLGHPLHPVLTDGPIGCWMSAVVVDLTGQRGGRRAAQFLVGAGVLLAAPTAVAGLADWADTGDEARRIGTFHALFNIAATTCFTVSWFARRRQHYIAGRTLALAGTAALTAGASLGGHLVYRSGIGVDVNASDERPREWTGSDRHPEPLPHAADVLRVTAAGARVLATRSTDGAWRGIGARCSHRDGPLDEGWFVDDCVTCPWHHSRFRLADGSIVDGPATAPQPRYDVVSENGTMLVRAHAGVPGGGVISTTRTAAK